MFYNWQGDNLILNVRIQPRASDDGKTNKHLIGFLAKIFKIAKSNISIITGETGKNKQLQIKGPQRLPGCIVDAAD